MSQPTSSADSITQDIVDVTSTSVASRGPQSGPDRLFRFEYKGQLSEVYAVVGPCTRRNRPPNPHGPAWWVDAVHEAHAGFVVVSPISGRPGRSECVASEILAHSVEVTADGKPVQS